MRLEQLGAVAHRERVVTRPQGAPSRVVGGDEQQASGAAGQAGRLPARGGQLGDALGVLGADRDDRGDVLRGDGPSDPPSGEHGVDLVDRGHRVGAGELARDVGAGGVGEGQDP